MLHLSQLEITSIKPSPNRIIVLVGTQNKQITAISGIKIDPLFNPEMHAPTTGTVVNICQSLDYSQMEWQTDMNIERGDKVVFSYTSSMYCQDSTTNREIYDEHNNRYFIIDYGDVFCVKRGETIIPVNGYLLVEPVKEDLRSKFKLSPSKSAKLGRVVFTSPPNKDYRFMGTIRDDVYDFTTDEVKSGDIILFSRFSNLPIEHHTHKSIYGDKELYRMQRRDILQIFNVENQVDVIHNLVLPSQ